jgi:hypothetical protein
MLFSKIFLFLIYFLLFLYYKQSQHCNYVVFPLISVHVIHLERLQQEERPLQMNVKIGQEVEKIVVHNIQMVVHRKQSALRDLLSIPINHLRLKDQKVHHHLLLN